MNIWPLVVGVLMAVTIWHDRASRTTIPAQESPYDAVLRDAAATERAAAMPGFTAFALAVADRESNGNPDTFNDDASEAAAAARGYARNRPGIYALNPYPPGRWTWGSGGLYGQLPSTALAAEGFHLGDPYLVFDRKAANAMFVDYLHRIVRNHFSRIPPEHRTFLTLRRFMSSNVHGYDWAEKLEKSPAIRMRFARDLRARGIAPNFMHQRVRFGGYPGALAVYRGIGGTP